MALGSFQNTALGISTIILLICLIIIAIVLMYTKSNGTYPPVVDSCPDYWTTSNYLNPDVRQCKDTEFGCCSDFATPKSDADGTNCPVKCYNSHQLGTTSSTCSSIPTEMDFSTDTYTGSSALCNKQTWAKQCDLTWDGVTNVSNAC
jgi:hypothetical protein